MEYNKVYKNYEHKGKEYMLISTGFMGTKSYEVTEIEKEVFNAIETEIKEQEMKKLLASLLKNGEYLSIEDVYAICGIAYPKTDEDYYSKKLGI